ncbi:UNVERIFIED_CONTAM: hypothetical protein GTU68_044466, partial [Idotea baltica]|nr:hypothetical protein [Idotea baltica]
RRPRLRLSARIDSVRADCHPPCRTWRHPPDRFRKHRHNQRPAHGPEITGGGHPCRRCAQGDRGSSDRRHFLRPGNGSDRGSGGFSRSSLPGLAEVQGWQGRRHLSRHSARCLLAYVPAGRGDMGRHGLCLPLLLSVGAVHEPADPGSAVSCLPSRPDGRVVRRPDGPALGQTPREYRPSPAWPGKQDRFEVQTRSGRCGRVRQRRHVSGPA